MRYMTTVATVQDMVAIADALEPDVSNKYIGLRFRRLALHPENSESCI
jgi:hypothetical protein